MLWTLNLHLEAVAVHCQYVSQRAINTSEAGHCLAENTNQTQQHHQDWPNWQFVTFWNRRNTLGYSLQLREDFIKVNAKGFYHKVQTTGNRQEHERQIRLSKHPKNLAQVWRKNIFVQMKTVWRREGAVCGPKHITSSVKHGRGTAMIWHVWLPMEPGH